jgi:hypothetical protein
MNMIKKIIGKIIPLKIKKQLVNFKILAFEYGQYKTIKNWDCVDKNSKKIPWYTYPAIEYLNNINFTEKSILEYGSGNSSIFWSNKSRDVLSIEHDREWYEKVKLSLNDNQTLLLKENNNEYEKSIIKLDKEFDVIIIDGIRRVECAREIEKYLNKKSNEGYLVILDNSDRYKETSKYLREELDLIEVDFHGFGPINNYTWTTSIFLSRNFKFKAIDNSQPNYSISGLHHSAE